MPRLNPEEEAALDDAVVRLKKQGFSLREIGEAIHRSPGSVNDRYRRLVREGRLERGEKRKWSERLRRRQSERMRERSQRRK